MTNLKIGGRNIRVEYVKGEEHFPSGELGISFL